MNYDEALKTISEKQRLGIVPGLSRINALLNKMDNPQNKVKVIHIAGTNGKGTVANLIAQNLTCAGYKVGLFTSPWVDDYCEQVQINGSYINREVLTSYIDRYKDDNVTEFELLTAIMYKYFYDEKVDYAVVECGMGGKDDSTNAVENPLLCVITAVSIDHTNFLGNTLEEIANEKSGIIKNNSTVVLYPNSECEAVLENRCSLTNSTLFKIEAHCDFRQNNIATARKCCELLGVDFTVTDVMLPARREYISDGIMLDGAHNKQGAAALAENLPDKEITAIIGMMRDKDVSSYLQIVSPYISKIIATCPDNPRSMAANELAEIARLYCQNVVVCENPSDALSLAKNDKCFILICGSFFLARQLRKDLQ